MQRAHEPLSNPWLLLVAWLLLAGRLSGQVVLWSDTLLEFSSQFGQVGYAASQVLGVPNTPPGLRGGGPTSWSPAEPGTGLEFVRVGFAAAGEGGLSGVRQIAIVETHNPGSVQRIFLESRGASRLVYEAFRPAESEADWRILRVKIPPTPYAVTALRLELNTRRVPGFQHIDAVAISDAETPIEAPIPLAGLQVLGEREELGPGINSRFAEIHPLVAPDGSRLYFTRKGHPRNAGSAGRDDIWVASRREDGRWKAARNLGAPLNDASHNYLNGISPDGNLALVAGSYDDPAGREGLYLARRVAGEWLQPEPLDIPGLDNRNEYAAFHLASDGRHILASLERPDGMGLKDLYVSRLQDDGSWSPLQTLGPQINTTADETTPYLAPDGVTLYFSTNGRMGYGSGDLFSSRRLDSSWLRWSEPLNLGPAINTPGWDANFSLEASGGRAYFTSFNPASESEDLYRLMLEPGPQLLPVRLLRGLVEDKRSGVPLEAHILGIPAEAGASAAEARASLPDGSFQVLIPSAGEVVLLFEHPGYFPVWKLAEPGPLPGGSAELRIAMEPMAEGAVYTLPGLAFEVNSAALDPGSTRILAAVAALLRADAGLRIEVAGHTNDRCDPSYCQELSERRARAVMAWLLDAGISPAQVQAAGYGKSRPLREGGTAEEREANQRVELRVLQRGP